MRKSRLSKKSNFIAMLFILLIALSICFATYYCLSEMNHYYRVYQNPLNVTATVTHHDFYDDDGDTDYCSYITYTAYHVTYQNIKFEDRDHESDLTPVGAEITVAVSPENPGKLLSKLANSGNLMPFITVLLSAIFAFGIANCIKDRRTLSHRGVPTQETIRKDALLTICGRFSCYFWLLLSVFYTALHLCYPLLIGLPVLYIAIGSGILWVFFLIRSLIDRNNIRENRYLLQTETLVKKEHIPDSESEDTYKLYYSSGGKPWWQRTTSHYYAQANIGDTVTSVYLPARKKPLLIYDKYGSAI